MYYTLSVKANGESRGAKPLWRGVGGIPKLSIPPILPWKEGDKGG